MQREFIVKSRSLGGTTDLTLLAPLKPGFIDSLESVTYKTRVKRLLDTLHLARRTTHEYASARLLSDSIERVEVIHSVRVAVIEPEDKVLLVVTFDGNWDSYIRILWDKVGTLLDLIFCSTVDYVTSHDHSFGEWLEWARRVQVETSFFYGSAGHTARDALYYRRIERMSLRGLGSPLNEMRTVLPSAQGALGEAIGSIPRPDQPPMQKAEGGPATHERFFLEVFNSGFAGLATLYRLTELFRPGTTDGTIHRLASISLLREFVDQCDRLGVDQVDAETLDRFKRQLKWLFPEEDEATRYKVLPMRRIPDFDAITPAIQADVQGGILETFTGVTHGVSVLVSFASAAAAQHFLSSIKAKIATASDKHQGSVGLVFRNLAFTPLGLLACGMTNDDLELFPEDFRQGMSARCGNLGDIRNNHPRRWRMPKAFSGVSNAPNLGSSIELGIVHAVLQLRCKAAPGKEQETVDYWESVHPLKAELGELERLSSAGVNILAIQSMRRRYRKQNGQDVIVEHFGYADGDGQPNLEKKTFSQSKAHLGEIVWGYNNAADPLDSSVLPRRDQWLKNGSFLVLRKYGQDIEKFNDAVVTAAKDLGKASTVSDPKTLEPLVYAKLMGRNQNGSPLMKLKDPTNLNDFDYADDPLGKQCPLHAHIRLANPRVSSPSAKDVDRTSDAMSRPPSIMRRSMSYGPLFGQPGERGLVFMAYNASLSEQFEVVQRWLTQGNSTGSSSIQSCPIVGVPENHFPRRFRFEDGATGSENVVSMALEAPTPMFESPAVFTWLEWGLYLFTPSISALRLLELTALAAAAAADAGAPKPVPAPAPWSARRGRQQIAQLQALAQTHGEAAAMVGWKAAIEDPEAINRLDSASLWAAIREDHDGILRTPYGVLVASRELQLAVYRDRDRFSVSGQRERLKNSIGDIALGKDGGSQDGDEYWDDSNLINGAISRLDCEPIFKLAQTAALTKINRVVDAAKHASKDVGNASFEVGLDAREVVDEVLADLCEAWFGIQGSPYFTRSGSDLTWEPGSTSQDRPPLYPGHFTALSRYMFQPSPGMTPVDLGQKFGTALTKAMVSFVNDYWKQNQAPKGPDGSTAPITAALFCHPKRNDLQFVASTLVGIMMGFTPTIIGAVLNVLREWEKDDRLFALRSQWVPGRPMQYAEAMALLHRPMSSAALMRPMPQLGWRIARSAFRLGPSGPNSVDILVGDKIVLAIVAGTQESLIDGQDDGRLMFGGSREENNHPTHACPGYHQGIAAMLGTLAAIVGLKDNIRPGAASLSFEIRGDSDLSKPVVQTLHEFTTWRTKLTEATTEKLAIGPEPGSKGKVICWGDSWLGYYDTVDMQDQLVGLGYVAPEDFCTYRDWFYLNKMASGPNTEKFVGHIENLGNGAGNEPKAILLSAGGNDSVEKKLYSKNVVADPAFLLNAKAPTASVINQQNLDAHLVAMVSQYERILNAIDKVLTTKNWKTPIILHGYDYPLPAPRPSITSLPKWIKTPFIEAGYVDSIDSSKFDQTIVTTAMHELIKQLNESVFKVLAKKYPNRVIYVDLRGTAPDINDWQNDMHLTEVKFKEAAMKIDAAIQVFWNATP